MASPIEIPSGTALTVRVIDTTTSVTVPIYIFMEPDMPGFTRMKCNAFSFLIEHPSGRKLLFDLGVRKDWRNLAPMIIKRIEADEFDVAIEKNVIDILGEQGMKGEQIEAIIWR